MDLLIETNAKEFGLRHGVISLEEVITWADALITKCDDPPVELFDVSLAKNLNSAIEALARFGKSNDKVAVGKLIFKYFYEKVSADNSSYDLIARGLFDMYLQDLAPMEPPSGKMACYWDDLDLAARGYVGSLADVQLDILNLLVEYKC